MENAPQHPASRIAPIADRRVAPITLGRAPPADRRVAGDDDLRAVALDARTGVLRGEFWANKTFSAAPRGCGRQAMPVALLLAVAATTISCAAAWPLIPLSVDATRPMRTHAGGLQRGRPGCARMAASPEQIADVRRSLASAPAILAPLTRGGNLPFRVLCAELCAQHSVTDDVVLPTVSEMVYAKFLLKGDPIEKARLRHNADLEHAFGVQIATNKIEEGVAAAAIAKEAGATFVDLNCGCPIYDATRRGVGSALLRRPDKLTRLVTELADGAQIPITVKVRTGPGNEGAENILEVVSRLADTQACAALTIHGRTTQQRCGNA